MYYKPDAPQEALLEPGDSGSALGSLIFGVVFMIVPTVVVFVVGGSDLVPAILCTWWSMKFGKLSGGQEGTHVQSAKPQQLEERSALPMEQSKSAPAAQDF